MPTKPRMGRPPKPPAEKQSVRVMINLTEREFMGVLAAAGDDGSVSAWIRKRIVRAAARRKS